jgi:hypothetical protein
MKPAVITDRPVTDSGAIDASVGDKPGFASRPDETSGTCEYVGEKAAGALFVAFIISLLKEVLGMFASGSPDPKFSTQQKDTSAAEFEKGSVKGQATPRGPTSSAEGGSPVVASGGESLEPDVVTPQRVASRGPEPDAGVVQPVGAWGTEGGMASYKRDLNASMDRAGIKDPSKRSFILTMAMMEDKDRWARDASKDGTASVNGPLNINTFVLKMGGENVTAETGARLPKMSLDEAVSHIGKAYDRDGPEKLKQAQRGGETTYHDGTSYKYDVYSKNFDFTHQMINRNPELMTNDTRVWTTTPWVGDGDK